MTPARRETYERDGGVAAARVAETEALDQAVLMADRYQRAFLRLMKAFRDNRRLFGALVVAGGQVNIAEQQVNLTQEAPPRSSRVRSRPVARRRPARVRASRAAAYNPRP